MLATTDGQRGVDLAAAPLRVRGVDIAAAPLRVSGVDIAAAPLRVSGVDFAAALLREMRDAAMSDEEDGCRDSASETTPQRLW